MKTHFSIVLTGTISPDESSPLATAPIKPSGYDYSSKDKYLAGEEKTSRLPRMSKYFESIGSLALTPYFPASGIRGALRRSSRDVLFDLIKDQKWSLNLHRLLTIGGVGSSGSETEINIDAIREFREKNPLVSLFGATSSENNTWIEGKLSVGHAIPSEPFAPIIVTGVRTDPLRRTPSDIIMLDEASAASLNSISNAGREVSKLKQQIKSLKTEQKKAIKSDDKELALKIEQSIKELEENLETAAEISGTTLSILMPLPGYEAIPPLLPLNQRIVGRNLTLVELGLFVLSLKRFSKLPLLGAHQAHGCGIIRAKWTISIGDITGELILDPFVGIQINGTEVSELFTLAEEEFLNKFSKITGDSLMPS